MATLYRVQVYRVDAASVPTLISDIQTGKDGAFGTFVVDTPPPGDYTYVVRVTNGAGTGSGQGAFANQQAVATVFRR